jgi:hypothetical protein
MGHAAESIPLVLQGIAFLRSAGCDLTSPFLLTTLAEVYGMAEQPQEGLDRLSEATSLVETTHERWAEAEMHRLRGNLLLSVREHAERRRVTTTRSQWRAAERQILGASRGTRPSPPLA